MGKLDEFYKEIVNSIDARYGYLYCITGHYDECIKNMINAGTCDSITVGLLVEIICRFYGLLSYRVTDNVDIMMNQRVITTIGNGSEVRINYIRFIYEFIANYKPSPQTIIALMNFIVDDEDNQNQSDFLLEVITSLERIDLVETEEVSNKVELLERICECGIVFNPVKILQIYYNRGNYDVCVRLVNELVSIWINNENTIEDAFNIFNSLNDFILDKVNNQMIKNDYYYLLRVLHLHQYCVRRDYISLSQELNEIDIIPKSIDDVDACVSKIMNTNSKVVRNSLNDVLLRLMKLFINYLNEPITDNPGHIDPNVVSIKGIIKAFIIMVNLIPTYFNVNEFNNMLSTSRNSLL